MKLLVVTMFLVVGVGVGAFPQERQFAPQPSFSGDAYLPRTQHVSSTLQLRSDQSAVNGNGIGAPVEIANLAPPPSQLSSDISRASVASPQEELDSYANFRAYNGPTPSESGGVAFISAYGGRATGPLNLNYNPHEYGEIVPGEFNSLNSYASFHNYLPAN